LKSSFLANVSHEVRTPLTGIIGFADVFVEEIENEQHREFAKLIRQSATRLLGLLNGVLDLAHLEGANTKIDLRPVVVGAEVSEALRLLGPLAEQKGLDLESDCVAEGTEALLEPLCLHQIVNNLVGNAIKFTERGRVRVRVFRQDASVVVKVTDTGIGISQDFLPYLFNEFRQEQEGVARSYGGVGLGLAITQKLVERMGGTIDVESTRGAGSTFTLSFPAAQPGSEADEDAAVPVLVREEE
jgi:signal transduction histidine kinase